MDIVDWIIHGTIVPNTERLQEPSYLEFENSENLDTRREFLSGVRVAEQDFSIFHQVFDDCYKLG